MDTQPIFGEEKETFTEKHPYLATMGRAAIVFGARELLKVSAKKVGVELGHGRQNNPSREGLIHEHPVIATTLAVAVAPALEELAFRELPKRYLDTKDDMTPPRRRAAELGIAATFAIGHAGKDALPLTQLIGGLNYYDIHRKKGLAHSYVAHATNNALAAGAYMLKSRKKR